MPVREKAVDGLAHDLEGAPAFDNITFTVRVNGETVTREEWYARRARYDDAYVRLVDRWIDWNRVLIEATSRHLMLDHPDEGYDGYMTVVDGNPVVGLLCPECIAEALLALSFGGGHDWRKSPQAPR